MKRLLLSTCVLLCCLAVQALPVTQEQAAEKAAAFLKKRHRDAKPSLVQSQQGRRKVAAMGGQASTANYYVFNIGDNEGFVVVAGDDGAEEVLAYGDTGHFDFDEMPENLRAWLEGYDEQMEWMKANASAVEGPKKAVAQPSAMAEALPVVAPLLRTLWHQKSPYNLRCFNSHGYQAQAGCTTIVMAQLMYHHRWPQTNLPSIPAYTNNEELPATTIDWNLIKDEYSWNANVDSEEEKQEVAKLVKYCGNALEVRYGSSSTGGTTDRIPIVMQTYFGYAATTREELQQDYTTTEWRNLLVDELRNGRPVIYSSDTFETDSHAFIIDGFDGDDMFHVVWGWGGIADGYYRLSAMTPSMFGASSTVNTSFSSKQLAVVGIQPSAKPVTPASKAGVNTFEFYQVDSSKNRLDEGTYNVGATKGLSTLYLYYSYRRYGLERAYDIGIGLFKGDELLAVKPITSDYSYSSIYCYYKYIYMSDIGAGLPDGEYTLKGVDRASGTETWWPNMNSDEMYLRVSVANKVATVTTPKVTGVEMLQVTGVEQVYGNDNGVKHLRVGIANVGDAPAFSPVYLFLNGKMLTAENPSLAPGEETVLDYYITATAGTCKLAFSLSKTAGSEFYTDDAFILSDASELPLLTLVEGGVANMSGTSMYGREMNAYMVLKNETDTDYLHYMKYTVSIYYKTSSSPLAFTNKVLVDVPAGSTSTVTFQHPLALGDMFFLQVDDENKTYVKTPKYTVVPGVVTWTADGVRTAVSPSATVTVAADVAAVSFEDIDDLSAVTVVANKNPNTLYYLRHDATVPTALASKNVVLGRDAASFKLTGGYGYFVPQPFTAKSVSYTFTPSRSYDGNGGWMTVLTPFAVNKVAIGGKTVAWNQSASDISQKFLLKTFCGSTGREVCFEDADEWCPLTPYIMAVGSALSGKKTVLSATNAVVLPTEACAMASKHFRFVGSTADKTLEEAFVLNDVGNGFVSSANASVKAGEAYFQKTDTNQRIVRLLPIGDGVSPVLLGDLDGNGLLTVNDVLALTAYITSDDAVVDRTIADLNGDGFITVADIMLLVNIILGN